MAALLFSIGLFAYWLAVGAAVLALAPGRLKPRQAAMLAPAVGAAAVTLPVFWLNQLGMAVESFATPVLAVVGVGAAAVLAWKRPKFPARSLAPFLAVLFMALLLAGWPMLRYGFDWASYNNSDMTHYGLGTLRVLHGGFFDPPDLGAVVRGTDHSVYDAYKYILYDARSGSERMLAAIWAATGLNAHLIFMPVTMALHLVLVSSAAALAAGGPRARNAPLLVAALMAISPLTTLGAMYQLIAQVAGLAFLCASVALLYRAPRRATLRELARGNVALVLVMAALFIWYPELVPFLGLGWFAYLAMLAWRDRREAARAVILASIAGVLLLAVLNAYFVDAVHFMLSQAKASGLNRPGVLPSAGLTESAFPYFLLPSGLPHLWGLVPIAGEKFGLSEEPFLSGLILFSYVLMLWFLPAVYQGVKRASAPTAVFVVMIGLAIVLFRGNQDFGLFKLAMYMQPFLVVLVVQRMSVPAARLPARLVAVALLSVTGVTSLASQYAYVSLSTGEFLRGLNEVWRGSSERITAKYEEAVRRLEEISPAGLVSDTSSIVHLQHQTLHTRGYSALYPAMGAWTVNESSMYPNIAGQLPEIRRISLGGIDMSFAMPRDLRRELAVRGLVTIPRFDTIFNATRAAGHSSGYYQVYGPGAARDHLIFMPTDKGGHYYGYASRVQIAVNHLEHDPTFPGRQFSGLGRHFLFLAVNPSARPRVVVELSSTVMKHFDSALPKPSVHGASRQVLGFVGRGSGRVLSEPIDFASIDGVPFFAVDMGREAKPTPFRKNGLMKLYGTTINPDLRRLTTYGRDISLVSDEEYRAMAAPAALADFPRDLGNPGLEYSGIYEDGYISEESFFVLQGTSQKARVRIVGMVPGIDDMKFTSRIHVSVDGKPAASHPLALGRFVIEAPLPGDSRQKRRIGIRFDKVQKLPGGDDRLTGGKISTIALVAQPD